MPKCLCCGTEFGESDLTAGKCKICLEKEAIIEQQRQAAEQHRIDCINLNDSDRLSRMIANAAQRAQERNTAHSARAKEKDLDRS